MWSIVFGARPVTIEEVAETVIIEAGEVGLDKEAILHDPPLLLAICGSLVSFNGPHLGLPTIGSKISLHLNGHMIGQPGSLK